MKFFFLFFKAALNPLKKYTTKNQQSVQPSPSKTSASNTNNVDSSLIKIQIGGNTSGYNESFKGNIYGLVYNRFRLFDLVANGDQRVRTFGDLRAISEAEALQKQSVTLFFLKHFFPTLSF